MHKNRSDLRIPGWYHAITKMINVTDPCKDPDDEGTMVLLGNLTLQGLVHLLATVANLAPAERRAELAHATLGLLGMRDCPVGIGSSCTQTDTYDRDSYQWKAPYLRSCNPGELHLGLDLLIRQLEGAKDRSVTLLLISGMTDAATLLKTRPDLFKKIREVVIMGGVERKDNAVVFDNDGDMIAEARASNNAFDLPSALYLYKELQIMRIPMWILCKEAAYAAPVPRSMYEELAKTGHPVGIRLRDMQCASITHLWNRANMAANDPRREGLVPFCDRAWFLKTFCGVNPGDDVSAFNQTKDIWPHIRSFNLYDPITSLLGIPRYRNIYFEPHMVTVRGTQHGIVGLSAANHGIKYPKGLIGFVHSQMIEVLDVFAQAMRDVA